jgi:hypothetical protein
MLIAVVKFPNEQLSPSDGFGFLIVDIIGFIQSIQSIPSHTRRNLIMRLRMIYNLIMKLEKFLRI